MGEGCICLLSQMSVGVGLVAGGGGGAGEPLPFWPSLGLLRFKLQWSTEGPWLARCLSAQKTKDTS